MNARTAASAILSGSLLTGSAAAQDAVQWPIDEGGNGHWYMAVVGDYQQSWITWYEAQDIAETSGGYLATLTSQAEDYFVGSTIGNKDLWLGGWAFENRGCELDAWHWATGEPWEYTNWAYGGPWYRCDEDGLAFAGWGGYTGQWNNYGRTWTLHGYVVEWSADCNGDGIVDYGQILDGTYEDLDGNGIPDCCDNGEPCDCRVDLTNDGVVDTLDFLLYLGAWSQGDPLADWDGDGVINTRDFLDYLNDWVAGC